MFVKLFLIKRGILCDYVQSTADKLGFLMESLILRSVLIKGVSRTLLTRLKLWLFQWKNENYYFPVKFYNH